MFLSYRHADNLEMGRKWATWLHETVENYEIPADLIGKSNLRGEPVPTTLYPVFRDEEELPADADLSVNIRRALENSNLLVVLCSPRAVQSRFVADEIRHFKEIGKSSRILALMIDGEPNASDDPEKLERLGAAAECFPEPLKFGVPDELGRIDWTARTEPIAADCRPGGRPEQGWTTAAAYEEALQKQPDLSRAMRATAVREYAERLELAKLKVIAGALGLPLGELTQRDKARQLRKARQRARILTTLSVVFALLAGAAGALGWLANVQRKAADDARASAEQEKRQAIATLAASDFQEGVNRLSNPLTARGGLAYLARSARAGHESAATRIWTLFQQSPFWLPLPDSSIIPPETSKGHLEAGKPPAAFESVELDGERTAPTWYAASRDGKRCVTVVSNATAGEGPIQFRVWETSGTPIGPWRGIAYEGENYLSGIESAVLSDDGRFIAIIASPWRAPQFVEVWDVNRGVRIGDPLPAGGGHPNYQGGAFNDVWFTPHDKAAIGPMLVTLSNRGDAAVYQLDAGPENPSMWSKATNRHDQPVQLSVVDPTHKLLVSVALDHSIHLSSLEDGSAIGWPIDAGATVEALRVDAADRISIRLDGGKAAGWRLLRPVPAPVAPQTPLALTNDNDLHKSWPDGEDEEIPDASTAVVADQRGNRQLRILNSTDLQVTDSTQPSKSPSWSRIFPSAIVHARFSGDDSVIVQTGFFTTEVWNVGNDTLRQPIIDETALFTAQTSSDTALLSSLSPDGRLVLTRSFLWEPPNIGVYAFTVWDSATGKPLSARLRYVDDVAAEQLSINHAEFSADGNSLLLGRSGDGGKPNASGSIQLRPPAAAAPLIPDLAETLGGLRLKSDGNLESFRSDSASVLQMAGKALEIR